MFIWSVEFFTPSSFFKAEKGLTQLGWDIPRHGRESIVEAITRTRGSDAGGGWWNLGYLTRDKVRDSMSDFSKTAPGLPVMFAGASASLHSVSSSLTAIVFGFQFEEAWQSKYDEIIRGHYFTEYRARGRTTTSIVSPDHIRRERVRSARYEVRRAISEFIRSSTPGVFSSNKNEVPCVEFLELDSAKYRHGWESLSNFFVRESPYESWDFNDDAQSMRFHEKSSDDDHQGAFATITLSSEGIANIDLKSYGGSRTEALGYKLGFTLDGFMIPWGCYHLLRLFDLDISAMRDSQFDPLTQRARRAKFKQVKSRWEKSIDIASIAADLSQKRARYDLLAHAPKLTSAFWKERKPESNYCEMRAKQCLSLARSISQKLRVVLETRRDIDSSYALLKSGILERRMAIITMSGLFVSLLGLAVAGVSLLLSLMSASPTQWARLLEIVHGFGR